MKIWTNSVLFTSTNLSGFNETGFRIQFAQLDPYQFSNSVHVKVALHYAGLCEKESTGKLYENSYDFVPSRDLGEGFRNSVTYIQNGTFSGSSSANINHSQIIWSKYLLNGCYFVCLQCLIKTSINHFYCQFDRTLFYSTNMHIPRMCIIHSVAHRYFGWGASWLRLRLNQRRLTPMLKIPFHQRLTFYTSNGLDRWRQGVVAGSHGQPLSLSGETNLSPSCWSNPAQNKSGGTSRHLRADLPEGAEIALFGLHW